MGTNLIPSVDQETKQFRDDVRARIAANLADPATPEGAAVASSAGHSSVAAAESSFKSLRSALDSGRPACLMWIGDSTGDSDGTNPSDLRTPTRVALALADAYPDYFVMSKTLLPDGGGYGPSVVLRNPGGGRRNAHFGGTRSLRYRPSAPATTRFATGDVDIRVLYKPDQAWDSGDDRALVVRRRKDVDGADATSALEQFRFLLEGTGTLRFDWSTNGADFDKLNVRSTAPVTLSTSSPVWLRATLSFVAGSFTQHFYTSPDGQSWTELGSPIGPYASAPLFDASAGFFELGAEGWQPAASAALGRVYEVEVRDGIDGPTIAPVLPELWERYGDDLAATYEGDPTLILLNASRSGTALAYHALPGRLAIETADYGQQVVVFNDSHNEGAASGPAGWVSPYEAWVTAVRGRLPLAAAAVVLQNPHTAAWTYETGWGYSHKLRLDELRSLAAAKGWTIIDLFEAFTNDRRELASLIGSDGLHPTQAGYELASTVVTQAIGI